MTEKTNEFFACPYKTCSECLRKRPSSLPHHNPYKSRTKAADDNIYLVIDTMEADIESLQRMLSFMDNAAPALINLLLALVLLMIMAQS